MTNQYDVARNKFIDYYLVHRKLVRELMAKVISYANNENNTLVNVADLVQRSVKHDNSKMLDDLEKNTYIQMNVELEGVKYGSDEYKKLMDKFKEGIDRHYINNSHHPEHYMVDGKFDISSMSREDLIEMVCDWCAVSKYKKVSPEQRQKDFEFNKNRFGISDALFIRIMNTAKFVLADDAKVVSVPHPNLLYSDISNN